MARMVARRRLLPVLAATALAVTLALQASAAFLPAAPCRGAIGVSKVVTAHGDVKNVSAKMDRRGLSLAGLAGLAGSAPPASSQEAGEIATFKVDLEGDVDGSGEIKVRLRPDWAPRGVRRFKELARMGDLKDAAVFHVGSGVARFGLPADPSLEPARIKDDTVRTSNVRGTLSFAPGLLPHQRVNQMFFNLRDNAHLDKTGHAPIGEVVEGMDLVDRFYGGYGTTPKKDLIQYKGNKYLDKDFPKLSKIKSVDLAM